MADPQQHGKKHHASLDQKHLPHAKSTESPDKVVHGTTMSMGRLRCKPTGYSTTTRLTVSSQKGHRPLPSHIHLHLELLVIAHHAQEPLVGFTSVVDAAAG